MCALAAVARGRFVVVVVAAVAAAVAATAAAAATKIANLLVARRFCREALAAASCPLFEQRAELPKLAVGRPFFYFILPLKLRAVFLRKARVNSVCKQKA